MAEKRLRLICHKTKMCKFFIMGNCSKGGACNFAHNQDELKQSPDLTCTRVCPTLISEGCCQEAECSFAHSGDQLRRGNACLVTPMKPTSPQKAEGTAARAPLQVGHLDPVGATPQSPSLRPHLSPSSSHSGTNLLFGCGGVPRLVSGSSEVLVDNNAGAVMRNKFHKSKMCTFFAIGRCRKKNACNFAHSLDELQPLPDLYRTKMCPLLGFDGRCSETGCLFAHTELELRTFDRREHRMDSSSDLASTSPSLEVSTKDEYGYNPGAEEELEDDMGPSGVFQAHAADKFKHEIDIMEEMFEDSQTLTRQVTEDPAALMIRRVRVKNTFFCVEDIEENEEEEVAAAEEGPEVVRRTATSTFTRLRTRARSEPARPKIK